MVKFWVTSVGHVKLSSAIMYNYNSVYDNDKKTSI